MHLNILKMSEYPIETYMSIDFNLLSKIMYILIALQLYIIML